MTTWSTRVSIKQNIPQQTKKLKIRHQYRPSKQQKSTQSESNIPLSVRYEKEINSDDDMFIHASIRTKKSNISRRFVFNDFSASQQLFLFKLTLLYLEQDDCIAFLKYCQKYANILENDTELLYFWKYICAHEKEWEQAQEQHSIDDTYDYKFWKSRYENWRNEQCTIKYNPKYGHLTFYKEGTQYTTHGSFWLMGENENSMIIVSKNRCDEQKFFILDSEFLATSNWYDIEDNNPSMRAYVKCSKYQNKKFDKYFRRSVRNPGETIAKYIISKGLIRKNYKQHILGYSGWCYGYMKLTVDLMMENLYIRKRGVKRYNIEIVNYVKHEFYMLEILPVDKTKGDGNNRRRCELLSMKYGYEHEALIVHGIVTVDELQLKMKEKKNRGKKLKVIAYLMECEDRYSGLDANRCGCDLYLCNGYTFVVVDYY